MNRRHTEGSMSGPFGLCSEIWDKEKNRYIRATDSEIWDCCMRTNLPLVKKCAQKCHELGTRKLRKSCARTCHDISKMSIANCVLSSEFWGVDKNPISKATKLYGCGDESFKNVDTKCMEKNKENILSLCQRECIPSITTDCTKNCDFSYRFLVDPDADPLKKRVIQLNNELNLKGNPTGTGNSVYIGYALGVAVILLGLYILFRGFVGKR